MEFTHATFKNSFSRFKKSLEAQNLGMNMSSVQNLWGELVLGKDYSAAIASLNRHGKLKAKNISPESIRACLKNRSRDVDLKTATSLFTESVVENLQELSGTMHDISCLLKNLENSCVITASDGDLGLGILRANEPGYIPIETVRLKETVEGEFAWLKSNSSIVVSVINSAAGVGNSSFVEIFAANSRESDKKADRTFALYFSKRVRETAVEVANVLLEGYDVGEGSDDSFDYDEIRDEIEDVFHRLAKQRDWVRPDCNFGETLIDHLTARVRETLKWLSYPPGEYDDDRSEKKSLENATELAMNKFFDAAGYARD
jgi:hypothetical protein